MSATGRKLEPRSKEHDQTAHHLAVWLEHNRPVATWENIHISYGARKDYAARQQSLHKRFGCPAGRYGYQPDVLSLDLVGIPKHANVTAYEVKVSRNDFLRDLRAAKWVGMCMVANRAYFAIPRELLDAGLINRHEIPSPCGLIVMDKNIWRIAKRCRHTGHVVSKGLLLKLALARRYRAAIA